MILILMLILIWRPNPDLDPISDPDPIGGPDPYSGLYPDSDTELFCCSDPDPDPPLDPHPYLDLRSDYCSLS